ncbi:MAG: helix-turn-helix transcriptional regulator [Coriobacteriaceae bacterium]|nr:helix-turn-helix transcriptional regulator [Coriobacteriaceae bacterium]
MQRRIIDAKGFGAAIRESRRKQKLTQASLADFFSSFSREFLSDLENGKPTVELEKAISVAHALGLRIYLTDDAKGGDSL